MSKFNKKIICFTLLFGLLLCGCGGKDDGNMADGDSSGAGDVVGQLEDVKMAEALDDASKFDTNAGIVDGEDSNSDTPAGTEELDGTENESSNSEDIFNSDMPGFFDSIDDTDTESSNEEGDGENSKEDSSDGENPDAKSALPVCSDTRQMLTEMAKRWREDIPQLNISLFKLSDKELLEQIKGQYAMSLRVVWGNPAPTFEGIIGGYQDTWSCSTADGSFSAKIRVVYNGNDAILSDIVSVKTEVLVDTKGIVKSVEEQSSTDTSSAIVGPTNSSSAITPSPQLPSMLTSIDPANAATDADSETDIGNTEEDSEP